MKGGDVCREEGRRKIEGGMERKMEGWMDRGGVLMTQ